MFWTYILQSLKDKRTYVGYAKNVVLRLNDHNYGKVSATKHRRPLKLLFAEKWTSLQKAKKRELYWKGGGGRRKLKRYFELGFPPIDNIDGRGSPK